MSGRALLAGYPRQLWSFGGFTRWFCDISSILRTEINSLWPCDVLCRSRSGLNLFQVMAWCRQAPSHYLNQCWRTMDKILWHSFQGNLMSCLMLKISIPKLHLKFTHLKSQRGRWVKVQNCSNSHPKSICMFVQYISRHMHTVHALLCSKQASQIRMIR